MVLVRHGATDWSDSLRHTGWTDLPLNQSGLRQAAALAQPLAHWSFSAVLCSPLQRALATCELSGHLENAQIDQDLREWNYGDYEGLTSAEIRAQRPGWNIWDQGVVGGETLDQLGERVDRVVTRLRTLSGDVCVFGHGHALRVLGARWIDRPPLLAQNLNLATATISQLGWEREWPSITLWNQAQHLGGVD